MSSQHTKIFGLHAVRSAIDYSADKIHKAWIDAGRQDRRLQAIVDDLSRLGLALQKVNKKQLERLSNGGQHQGIVVQLEMPQMLAEEQLKQAVCQLQETPFYLVLDHVQDPHNLGACLRIADAVGVQGIIITRDQAAGITPTVCKVASGAAETVPVYQVTNLARVLRWLKKQAIWVIGAAGEAQQSVYQVDLDRPLALVIGAEGKGLRRLTREQCDLLIKLPMSGSVQSLNLSVATGVMLYEAIRQRQEMDGL